MIAVSGIAPVMAASGSGPSGSLGDACKLPGNSCGTVFKKGYVFEAFVTNTTGQTIYLYNTASYPVTVTDNSPTLNLVFEAAAAGGVFSPFPVELAPGGSVTLVLNAGENDNSANISGVLVTVGLPWGHTPDPVDDEDTVSGAHSPLTIAKTYDSAPPVNGGQCTVTIPPNC
ncbi:hypothetical protein K0651_06740 [Ornithinimicrobium sp. Arc0846-15]|nr:hypothetical protein [Ornithinimicrobium laminariae]